VSAVDDFRSLRQRVVDDLLAGEPVLATALGDHRFDDRLADHSSSGVAAQLHAVNDHLTALDAVDDVELDLPDLVDLEILRSRLLRTLFELDDLRRHTWDATSWNPGTALHLLVSRDTTPAAERGEALRGRVRLIPDHLATARGQLHELSGIHAETAIAQLAGTRALLDTDVRALATDDEAVDAAIGAVDAFSDWLAQELPGAHRDPRLGGRLYAGALWHGLDEEGRADSLLADAQSHLAQVTVAIVDAAREYLGLSRAVDDDDDEGGVLVRRAMAEVARRHPVTDATVLPLMRAALDDAAAFARDNGLVSVPELDVRLVDMPAIHRGVAVAYCDAPGPLERPGVPTFVAMAPTPGDWSADRVASFYREYNAMQLHDLAVHEGVPGHVLQLGVAREAECSPARALGRSGVFIEGWAVYAEQFMVDAGYAPGTDPAAALALRLQQLKMQLRMTINAILDVGVHAHGLPEHEAMWLMREAGFQEEAEAAGKWRRALLTAGQLPTYFVGFRAVSALVGDLEVMHADWTPQRIHDLVLEHGSCAPRHRRTLLGI
jgi:uncharacterized protein (DUF885 family)